MKNIPMIKAAITLLALSTLGLANAQAQLLVDFDLNGYTNQYPTYTPISTSTYGSTAANIGNSSIDLGDGADVADATTATDRQVFTGFGAANLADAITDDDYISFNVDAQSGFQFTVDEIFIQHRADSGSTFSGVIRSSVDSYATDLATVSFSAGIDVNDTMSISGVTNQTSVEFRLYAWGDSTSNFQVRDLDVGGTVIPEPSTAGLLCAAMGLVLLVRRRRLC